MSHNRYLNIGRFCAIGLLEFHVHQNGVCEITNPDKPFESAGGHYNPTNQPHGSVSSLEKLTNRDIIVTNML